MNARRRSSKARHGVSDIAGPSWDHLFRFLARRALLLHALASCDLACYLFDFSVTLRGIATLACCLHDTHRVGLGLLPRGLPGSGAGRAANGGLLIGSRSAN